MRPRFKITSRLGRVLFAILMFGFLANRVFAHEPSKSYLHLTLESNQFTGQWDIPLRDLQTVVSLDPNAEGFVSWEKLHARYGAITAYAFSHLQLSADGQTLALHVAANEPSVEEFSDGAYLQIPLIVETPVAANSISVLQLTYRLFFETNSLHRGLLLLEADGKTQNAVFNPATATQTFELRAASRWRQFGSFLREGIWHIWTGYDHILFLLALLLPAVLQCEGKQWRGVPALHPAFINILKIVTAFTLAHSLTLSLATLGIVKIPSRITESAIAASVLLAAANNLWPLIRERGWIVAFVFGLIHGFGFATALSDLGVANGALWLTLIGFNLGVEIGQMAIVAVFLPVAFVLRKKWFYQTPLLRAGSAVIILIAGLWFAERVFNFKLLPF